MEREQHCVKEENIKVSNALILNGITEFNRFPFKETCEDLYFMVSIKAPRYREINRVPINLICVIDESGSMQGRNIQLVIETVKFIISNLQENDCFGCIGYSNNCRELYPLTVMNENEKLRALETLQNINANGASALCQGLSYAIEIMRQKQNNNISSILLLTDGDANVGFTNERDIICASTNTETDSTCHRTLPCTINTFGFGSNHNASLLQTIAEYGRGTYTYIEEKSTVEKFFAEWLRELISLAAQNVLLTVQCLNEVKINRCLSEDYRNDNNNNNNNNKNIETVKSDSKYNVFINDLQSEEQRNIIFEISLPAIEGRCHDWPVIELQCEYQNLISNKHENILKTCNINRIENESIGIRNADIDIQHNRLLTVQAMKMADKYAQQGKLEKSKNILHQASEIIAKSQTNENIFCKNLVKDIKKVENKLNNWYEYEQYGGKMLKMNLLSHKI